MNGIDFYAQSPSARQTLVVSGKMSSFIRSDRLALACAMFLPRQAVPVPTACCMRVCVQHGGCRAPSHRQKADRRILSCSGHTYCKGLLAVLDVRCWPDSGNAGKAGSVPLPSGQGRLRIFDRPVLLPTCSCHPGRALCPGCVRRQQFLRLPDRSGAGLIRSLNNVKTVIISSSGLASFRKTPYLCTRTLRNNLLW